MAAYAARMGVRAIVIVPSGEIALNKLSQALMYGAKVITLKGNFDFQIEWAPEETPDSIDASLFTVLKEQLGLKLRPARGTSEVLIIDQVMRPSAD